jgi:hypothetical protein
VKRTFILTVIMAMVLGFLGHLYYAELGNKGWCDTSGTCDQPGWDFKNRGPFTNTTFWEGVYMLGTTYPANTDVVWGVIGQAWYFYPYFGTQGVDYKGYNGYYALAVRPGDVAVVPEPISSILFITGGATLAVRRYIKRKKQ